MSPKRPVPITELLGHPPHRSPASSRIVPLAALGTQDGHRRKGRRAAAQPRPSRGAARSAPPGHVPHTAPLRLGPGPAPPHRAARDTRPLPAGLLAAAPPPLTTTHGAAPPPPAALRVPPSPALAPLRAAARPAARTAADRRCRRRRAARTRPRGAGRRGLAMRAEPRMALGERLGAAPGRAASRPQPRGQQPKRC